MDPRSARLAVLVLCLARGATAQSTSMAGMIGTNLKHSVGDAWGVWTAPARGEVQDWSIAAGVVALSAAISPFDDDIDRWAFKHRNDRVFKILKPFRTGGILFAGKTLTPVALGTLAVAVLTKNQAMQQGLLGCATAYASSSLLRRFVIYPLVAFAYTNAMSIPTAEGKERLNFFEDSHSFPIASEYLRGELPYRDTLPVHGLGHDGLGEFLAFRTGGVTAGSALRARGLVSSLNTVAIYALGTAMTGSPEAGSFSSRNVLPAQSGGQFG